RYIEEGDPSIPLRFTQDDGGIRKGILRFRCAPLRMTAGDQEGDPSIPLRFTQDDGGIRKGNLRFRCASLRMTAGDQDNKKPGNLSVAR
ncbi:MAG: hypothetical protein VZR54_09640, partial [Ruminococcus sp.]|nr:hypothetical protein [Ruminococcus sp.]